MKSPLLFFALLLQTAGIVFGQSPCNQDTLVLLENAEFIMDSEPPNCWPMDCDSVAQCHTVLLPIGTEAIGMKGDGNTYQLVLLQACRYQLWDTCVSIENQTPDVLLSDSFAPNTSLMVCGHSMSHFGIMAIDFPIGTPIYPRPAYLDLDTLCGPLNPVTQPIETIKMYWEFDGTHWREASALKPNGLYKVIR